MKSIAVPYVPENKVHVGEFVVFVDEVGFQHDLRQEYLVNRLPGEDSAAIVENVLARKNTRVFGKALRFAGTLTMADESME